MNKISEITPYSYGVFQKLNSEYQKNWFVISSNEKSVAKVLGNFAKKAVIAIAFVIVGIVSPLFFLIEMTIRSIGNSKKDKNAVTFFFVRHGETIWNAEGRAQGSMDIPLNEKGLAHGQSLAQMMRKNYPEISAIYSSNLSRAFQTALATGEILNLPVKAEPAFREICHGDAEGMKTTEKRQRYAQLEHSLDKKYPNREDRWKHTAIPNAETYGEVVDRVVKAMNNIAEKNRGKQIAIFTHSRVIKILIDLFSTGKVQHNVENCCIAEFHSTGSLKQPFKFDTILNLDT